MKKKWKNFTAHILALIMAIGCVPETTVAAAGADVFGTEDSGYIEGKLDLYQEGYLGAVPVLSGKLRGASDTTGARTAIEKALTAMNTGNVDISKYKLSSTQLKTVVSNVINNNPQFYYVSSSYIIYLKDGYVYAVRFTYNVSESEKKTMDAEINESVNEALDGVANGMTDIEKAIVLHDYLIEKVRYPETTSSDPNDNMYDLYGALGEGSAVCQGYALAYQYLLSKAGISSKFVPSKLITHAWNLVSINGKWYHVDVTWDDTNGQYPHKYFLLSDSARDEDVSDYMNSHGIKDSGEHWDITTNATSKVYDNYYWRNISSKFYYVPAAPVLSSVKATAYNKIRIAWRLSGVWYFKASNSYCMTEGNLDENLDTAALQRVSDIDAALGFSSRGSTPYDYEVCRSTDRKNWTTVATQQFSDASYTDTVKTGQTYYYKILHNDQTSGQSYESAVKSAKTALAATSKVTAKKTAAKKAKVSWKKVSGASGYEVYKSTKKSNGYTKIKTTKSLSYTYTKCTKGKTNYFRVRAYRTVNGKKVYSTYKTASVKM